MAMAAPGAPPPPPPPPSAATAAAASSSSNQSADSNTPLLSQYDPYHHTTFSVLHPLGTHPLELPAEAQRILRYGSQIPSWRLNYQDFSPDLHGGDATEVLRSNQTFQQRLTLSCDIDTALRFPLAASPEGRDHDCIQCSETCLEPLHRAVAGHRDLVDKANDWLRQNPHVRVRTCETLCWWTTKAMCVGDTEAVVLQQNILPHIEEDTFYLVGLRLWLVPNRTHAEVQQIQYQDHLPDDQESLSVLVKRINRQLEDQPLSGSILTTETVFCPQLSRQDSNQLLWRETQCQRGDYTIFVRLFSLHGPPQTETIGIKDFCPDVVNGKHESFGTLVKKASRWINEEKSIAVSNFKSLYVSRDNDCPVESADRCNQRSFSFDSHQYFQILRVFYVRRLVAPTSKYCMVNYVTFSPVQLLPGPPTLVDYEKMKQTIVRVTAWLQAAGAQVFGAESVTTPMIPSYTSQALPEITYWTPSLTFHNNHIRKCLLHIRVYLEGEYKEPDPGILPALPTSLTYGLEMEMLQREEQDYYMKKKKRKRRKTVFILICITILVATISVILLEQTFHFIKV